MQEAGAPWNMEDKQDKKFDCNVSQTLSKNTSVYTNDYEYDCGSLITDSVPWEDTYCEQHYTPLDLIQAFERLLEKLKEEGSVVWKDYYLEFLKECNGWVEDELCVTD